MIVFFFPSPAPQWAEPGAYVRKAPGTYVLTRAAPGSDMDSDEGGKSEAVVIRNRPKRGGFGCRSRSVGGDDRNFQEAFSYAVPIPMTLGILALRRLGGGQVLEELELASWQAVEDCLARLESTWASFNGAFDDRKGTDMTEEQISAISDCFAEGEEIYLRAKWQLRARLTETRPTLPDPINASVPASASLQTVHVQMAEPALVPKFSGNEEEWGNFRDAFMAEVHSNPRYSDAQKLRKLLSSLNWAVPKRQSAIGPRPQLLLGVGNDAQAIRQRVRHNSGASAKGACAQTNAARDTGFVPS